MTMMDTPFPMNCKKWLMKRAGKCGEKNLGGMPVLPNFSFREFGDGEAVLQIANLPDLILIDGGKGQFGMAFGELKNSALKKFPSSDWRKNLKKFICRKNPNRCGSVLNHPAVKLLQRIRDESHRVANSYNAQLRLKRISESVLDEFPGIGERRKAALLKKFGSVQRLKTATLEQIIESSRLWRKGGEGTEEIFGSKVGSHSLIRTTTPVEIALVPSQTPLDCKSRKTFYVHKIIFRTRPVR